MDKNEYERLCAIVKTCVDLVHPGVLTDEEVANYAAGRVGKWPEDAPVMTVFNAVLATYRAAQSSHAVAGEEDWTAVVGTFKAGVDRLKEATALEGLISHAFATTVAKATALGCVGGS